MLSLNKTEDKMTVNILYSTSIAKNVDSIFCLTSINYKFLIISYDILLY